MHISILMNRTRYYTDFRHSIDHDSYGLSIQTTKQQTRLGVGPSKDSKSPFQNNLFWHDKFILASKRSFGSENTFNFSLAKSEFLLKRKNCTQFCSLVRLKPGLKRLRTKEKQIAPLAIN